MLTDQIKELNAAKAKLSALESTVAAELKSALGTLPGQYGFADVATFATAVRAACDKRRGRKPKSEAAAPRPTATNGRRKRAIITDATRAEVRKLVEARKTGSEIAAMLGISLPSVHNVKMALGLVKKRAPAKK